MKGKPQKFSSSSLLDYNNDDNDYQEDTDCPLQFPDIRSVDHVRLCPRYTSILSRKVNDGIGPEELDTLQSELETLLAEAAKRTKLLEEEKNTLSLWLEKGEIKKLSPKAKDMKRLAASPLSQEKPSKRSKIDKRKSSIKLEANKIKSEDNDDEELEIKKEIKVENNYGDGDNDDDGDDDDDNDDESPLLSRFARNETPLRFWRVVDSYCGDIQTDHLKLLEDIIKNLSDNLEYFKIPQLGKHYAEKWAVNNLEENKSKSDKERLNVSPKKKNNNNNNSNLDEIDKFKSFEPEMLLKNLQSTGDPNDSPFQPLTQLLIQSLIDDSEELSILNEPISNHINISDSSTVSSKSLAKQVNINVGTALSLERRIKRELIEQGFIEKDDDNNIGLTDSSTMTTSMTFDEMNGINDIDNDTNDNEIIKELKEKQLLLKTLTDDMLNKTKKLYNMAKCEMQLKQLKNKLNACDQNVLDAYNKIISIKSKKKVPNKKEKECVIRALKQRQTVSDAVKEIKQHFRDLKLQKMSNSKKNSNNSSSKVC